MSYWNPTCRELNKTYMRLQNMMYRVKGKDHNTIVRAMRQLDVLSMKLRRKAIYEAGSKRRTPPRYPIMFEGYELGSMEAATYQQGYLSRHPAKGKP